MLTVSFSARLDIRHGDTVSVDLVGADVVGADVLSQIAFASSRSVING